MIWTPGWLEIVIILAILLLVFGRRLPDVMRNLGRGLTQFKRGMRESVDEIKEGMDEADNSSTGDKREEKAGD
jgi:sec-independent protein translocase protein TatA